MTEKFRTRFFLLSGFLLFGVYCYGAKNLPAWGYYRGPYGVIIANLAVFERHATDVVNAINYDYRGFDTLGEEFILFTAVLGVMLLLRREEETGDGASSEAGRLPDRRVMSMTIQAITPLAVFFTVILGFYIGLHGQLTPGGGFQAGVILATASFLVYLAQNTEGFTRITSHPLVEFIEALGAGSYALIGTSSLLIGVPFLTNILPLGETGDIFSSGNIALISACVGVEVTGSFLLVAFSYLQEIIEGRLSEN